MTEGRTNNGQFQKGVSGCPGGVIHGRVPTDAAIRDSLKGGCSDAIDTLIDILRDKDCDEGHRANAAKKIAEEAIKLKKTGKTFASKDVRRKLLVNFEEAIIELKVLMKTAESYKVQLNSASFILNKALIEMEEMDTMRLEKKASKGETSEGEDDVVVPILRLKAE